MDLAARRSATQHTNIVMRLWALLVSLALAFSLVIQPPRAKAFAAVGQLYTVVSAFMASCGLSWGVQGMDETGFGDQVAKLLQDYLDTEFAGQTPLEWAGDFTAIATPQGKLQIPKMLVEKFSAFANWTIEKLGIKAGGSTVVSSNFQIADVNGNLFKVGTVENIIDGGWHNTANFTLGSLLFSPSSTKESYEFLSGHPWEFYFDSYYLCFKYLNSKTGDFSVHFITSKRDFENGSYLGVYLILSPSGYLTYSILEKDGSLGWTNNPTDILLDESGLISSGVSIDAATAIDVPDASTMADDEALEIGVGAAAGVALDVLLKQILDAILAGNLAATQEIAKAEEGTKPGEITDVDSLGLPALGAALTTRFPFSIPWDFVGAVKLLASPPKAPRWEVDLLAPIEERYGAFPGETKIVIDMSDYPLVGQVSRWFTTLMFGWGLIMVTKKLIW